MFNDDALRKFQDQLIENDCDQAPIENFAREWFERFTTGVHGHNEPDVKRLSKGLANCRRNNAWKVGIVGGVGELEKGEGLEGRNFSERQFFTKFFLLTVIK